MKPTEKLHDVGQSLWLDNITRDLVTSGTLKRYIDPLSVSGLTSNPTIFDHAISKSAACDKTRAFSLYDRCSPLRALSIGQPCEETRPKARHCAVGAGRPGWRGASPDFAPY